MTSLRAARTVLRPGLFLWTLALPALLVSSCICSTSGVNRGDINLVPLEEEWQMGAQLEQEMAQQLDLLEDPVLGAYLQGVGQRLVRETELAEYPWEFHLVRDSSVNAFVVPGGHVYVHTGLIAAAETEAELAGVLAHEVAHGVARHATERLTKLYGLDFVARLLLSENPGLIQQVVAQLIGSGAVAKFSRDAEREADHLGVRYLHEAGYDPAAMASMFETLLAQRRHQPGMLERFFSSHPLTEERIENVRREAEGLPEQADPTTDTPAFAQARSRARQLQ